MRSGSHRVVRQLAGSVLLVLALAAALHGVCTDTAQWIYYRAKFGTESGNPETALRLCRRGWPFYHFNYRLCMHAADTAYFSTLPQEESAIRERLRLARLWCDRALSLDRHKREMRWLKAEFLWGESPQKAIAYWKEYVDWEFWVPYNHAALAQFLAKAGDIESAEKEAVWFAGSEYEKVTREVIEAERAKLRPTPAPPAER